MIFSGVPGVSGLGAFVLGRGYTLPVTPAQNGNYSIEYTNFQTYTCVIRPRVPISLITKIYRYDAEYDPAILISENDIPHT
jgi:hypothetical protein